MLGHRVRVSVLSGFLGAGKTSFLRHVLSADHGLRIAVVQNEISAVRGIEAATVVGDGGETFSQYIELPNGCVCCTVRDELPVAIERLIELNEMLDVVLVETTGMAQPGPVATSLWLDAELESPIDLDGILTVVDAHHVLRQLEHLEACVQIASADCILLNKVDGCSEAHLLHVTALLRALNALAPVLRTTHSRAPLNTVLHLNAYAASDGKRLTDAYVAAAATAAAAAVVPTEGVRRPGGFGRWAGGRGRRAKGEAAGAREAAGRVGEAGEVGAAVVGGGGVHQSNGDVLVEDVRFGGGDGDGDGDGGKGSGVGGEGEVVCVACEQPDGRVARWLHTDLAFGVVNLSVNEALSMSRLRLFLAALFWEAEGAAQVYRAKGALYVAGEEKRQYALQAVHDTYELAVGPEWRAGEARTSHLVLIGRHLNREALHHAFSRCLAAADEAQAAT
eukprot:CAMPEP_0119358808 /NCGR_PEP_ID=MMETSP1334-20130426/6891_1 /TAXON_ID=127549 /ORGANISM="Calcidiscus leptoporus, Strain RCC1130" /LENGTH=448 /DNA_ID=CAMNT_0007373361 /DNA_START=329 /DNA_END=1675 /DNA_ORIENTATION=+